MQQAFNLSEAREKWSGVLTENFNIRPDRADWAAILSETAVRLKPQLENSIFEAAGYPDPVPGVTTGLIGSASFENPNNSINQDIATPKGSGDLSAVLFGLQLHVANTTVGFDLVPVVPITLPSVKFIFADEYYAGGVIKAGVADNPIYISLSGGGITGATNTFTPVKGEYLFIIQANAGGTAAADGNASYVRFIKKNRITGAWVVRVVSTGTLAIAAYTAGTTLNVADVIGTSNAVAKATNATTALTTAGNVQYLGAATPIKIDLVSATDDTVVEASNADGFNADPMDRDVAENGTKISLGLKMWSTTVTAKDYEILAELSRIQRRDMTAHGYDPDGMLVRAGKNQITQSINDHILRTLFRLGVESHAQLKLSQGVDLNLFVGPSSTANKALSTFGLKEFVDTANVSKTALFPTVLNNVANSSAESYTTRQRMLASRIFASAALIGTVSRYGPGDMCCINSQLGAALRDNKNFAAAPMDNSLSQAQSTLYYLGDIGGVRIYVDPNMSWNDTRVLVGRKGGDNDSGLKFFAYQLVDTVSTLSESTMAPVYLFVSSYALASVGFNPASNYLTFGVANDFGIWT